MAVAMDNVVAVILAGGRGERLSVLAQERTKPAVPFAGKYRIIDFALNNCVNSGIRKLLVLTQYQPLSLIDHIGAGRPWGLDRLGYVLKVMQPYLAGSGRGWYKGTADAVYQNLRHIEALGAETVLILAGDHISKMDYSWMLNYHEEKQADVTLAFTHLPQEDLQHFGTVMVDEAGRVTGFQEKVKQPKSNLVSMGVYFFRKDILRQCLERDAHNLISRHDFGRDVLPRLVGNCQLFGYDFQGYWRDVGTVRSYWESNMDMLAMSDGFLSDAGWPIRTNEDGRASAIFSEKASVINSLISGGCYIEGRVEHSVLSPGVKVLKGALVRDSVIMSDSIIGADSVVDYAILDKEVVVGAGCHLGYGEEFRINPGQPYAPEGGITIVGKGARIPDGVRIGRDCVIWGGVGEEDFHGSQFQSGRIIKSRR